MHTDSVEVVLTGNVRQRHVSASEKYRARTVSALVHVETNNALRARRPAVARFCLGEGDDGPVVWVRHDNAIFQR